jgi:hypothetical protein
MRVIQAKMPDGSVWHIDARPIAEDRARHYAAKDPSTTYDDEVRFAMGDDYEVIDWARNNMDWDELAPHARMVTPPTPQSYDEQWTEAETRVADAPAPEPEEP